MKWAIASLLAALTATIVINAVLLGYVAPRNDPVGQLSPIAYVPPASHVPQPAHRLHESEANRHAEG